MDKKVNSLKDSVNSSRGKTPLNKDDFEVRNLGGTHVSPEQNVWTINGFPSTIKVNETKNLFSLLRPQQWIKNGFVFIGFFFAEQFTNFSLLYQVIIAAVAFCLASSCVYIFNDIADVKHDRLHPWKKERSLPSGKVTVSYALVLSTLLGISALLLGAYVSIKVAIMILCYLFINVLYSFWLKHIVILDVFCISSGFMLRIFAGTVGVNIPPSEWLLLCGLLLTLFLGFTKRRAEIKALANTGEEFRKVLSQYGSIFLDELISICAAGVIISYSLYTMSQATVGVHHTTGLIYTVPFVIYGVFRYLFLLHTQNLGEDPSNDVVRDPHMIVSVVGWAFTCVIIMYYIY